MLQSEGQHCGSSFFAFAIVCITAVTALSTLLYYCNLCRLCWTSLALLRVASLSCSLVTHLLLSTEQLCVNVCVLDGVCCYCPLQPEEGWQADLQHMESLIDSRTKLILITNPSNPCGSVYTQDHIRAITDIAVRHRLPVIADEIYMGVEYGGRPFHAVHVTNREVPVVLCGGLGKRYMVPGWRVGWLVVFDRHNYFKSSVSYAAPPTPLPAAVMSTLPDTQLSSACALCPVNCRVWWMPSVCCQSVWGPLPPLCKPLWGLS